MAIDVNIPSQVKNYANLAAFPATGTLKTIFIAEDTNKTYRWTGSAYVEISASQAAAWGTITGTLSSQTDLNTALSGKVPTTRTLTINGTTQDLSADRTFTISTGITIGTTAITSGTVGRVLFEGTGNVVQESANLFWDNTNARLGVGTATPTKTLSVVGSATSGFDAITFKGQYSETGYLSTSNGAAYFASGSSVTGSYIGLSNSTVDINAATTQIRFYVGSERMKIGNTGNVLINTTTDAGFKLDVNGTARVSNDLTIGSNRYLKAFRWTNDDVTRALQIEANSNYNVDGLNIISWNNNLLNNTKNIVNIGLSSTVTTQSSGSTDFFNSVLIQTAYNFTFGTHTVKGIYYNPTLTSMVNTTHYAFHSTSGRHRYENLPTSPTGLASGDLWNNLGVLMIV